MHSLGILTELMASTMLTFTSTFTVTDNLLQFYNIILLQISHKLDKNNRKKLRHYCNGFIPRQVTDTLDILRTLEHERKISWEDINFVKEAMHEIRRVDIAEELAQFEIKRDLTLLLDFYARKILEFDLHCSSVSVKIVTGHLVRLMKIVRDKVDIAAICPPVDSSKAIRKALVDFEEEIDCKEPTFSWNEFTMLVIIAGEIIAAASLNEERQEPVTQLCFTAADELYSRMIELGNWEEFCVHVKERYNLVYHRQNMESNYSLSLQKQRAEAVQQLADAIFFPVNNSYN